MKVRSRTGKTGLAKVENKKGKITLHFKEGGTIRVKDKSKKDLPDGIYQVKLNAAMDEIWRMVPTGEKLPVRFVRFSAKQNEPPKPFQRNGKYGPYYTYGIMMEVAEGDYQGLVVTASLFYKFEEDTDGSTYLAGKAGTDSIVQNENFLKSIGLYGKEIKYRPNLLPWLQKKADKETVFSVVTDNNGYVSQFIPNVDWEDSNSSDSDDDDTWDDDDDLPWDEVEEVEE